jgi:hypothetical protein
MISGRCAIALTRLNYRASTTDDCASVTRSAHRHRGLGLVDATGSRLASFRAVEGSIDGWPTMSCVDGARLAR